MISLQDTFDHPLPGWIDEIKAAARGKIVNAPFARACRQGDSAAMQGLVVGLWPFVDEFPRSIIRFATRLPKLSLFGDRALLNALLHRGPTILSGIQKDEENHRKLWLEAGQALGLSVPEDFRRPGLHETQTWLDAINAEADPSTILFRFAAVEIIAETVSVDFLRSEVFRNVLGEKGCAWFRVHAEHGPGMSHEELELRLAFAFLKGEPTKEFTNSVIQQIVDLSVAAENACAGLTHEILVTRSLP